LCKAIETSQADEARTKLLRYGSVEREGEVVHVIARRLADHSELLGRLATSSRDFHYGLPTQERHCPELRAAIGFQPDCRDFPERAFAAQPRRA
jgi:hypothetical protein